MKKEDGQMRQVTEGQIKNIMRELNVGLIEARRVARLRNIKKGIRGLNTDKETKEVLFSIVDFIKTI